MKRNTSYRKSQQIYKAFNQALASFEDIDPAIIGLTSSGEIIYVNVSACGLVGYSKKELQGRPFETIAPDMTAEAWSSFWSGLDHADFEQGPTTLHISGTKKLSVEFRTLFILDSSIKYCLVTRAGEEPGGAVDGETLGWPLIQVLNSTPDHVVVLNDQHKITFLNQALGQSLGISLAEALATTVYDYLPERHADIAWEHEQRALDSMRPSSRFADAFLQAKYGDTVTMLPFLDRRTSQKRLLVIISRTPQTGRSLPAVIPEPLDRVPARTKPGYASELHEILERSAPLGIFLKNSDNRYLWVNDALARMAGFEPKNLIGRRVEDLISDPELLDIIRKEDNYIYSTGRPLFNQVAPLFNRQSGYYRLDKLPFTNRNGKLVGVIGLVVEVDEPAPPIEAVKTELSLMSRKLQETETALRVLIEHREKDVSLTREELQAKVRDLVVPYLEHLKQTQPIRELKDELASTSKKLMETETALRVLIERREQDVSLTREELNAKVKNLVVPYLELLKQTRLNTEQAEFVDLMETNLKNFYDPSHARLSSPTYKLSPTELKVAQFIRDGKSNKEIARLLHLSKSTILTHRHHLRVKLGIKNKKINLRSLLNS